MKIQVDREKFIEALKKRRVAILGAFDAAMYEYVAGGDNYRAVCIDLMARELSRLEDGGDPRIRATGGTFERGNYCIALPVDPPPTKPAHPTRAVDALDSFIALLALSAHDHVEINEKQYAEYFS